MILPSPSEDTKAYWHAASAGRFLLRHCDGCGRWLHPRRSQCCEGSALSWRPASGKGVLVAFTTVRYVLNPALTDQVPYTITLTRTDEGPQLITSIPGDDQALVIGQDMVISFDRVTQTVTLPRFIPA